MKTMVGIFKDSFNELKSVQCIAVTGMFIALFIVLDVYSIRIGESIKINFAFIALAAIGMMYGPVVSTIAALGGDIIGCIQAGQAPIVPLMLTAMASGFVYGIFLYKKNVEKSRKVVLFSIISRTIDTVIVNMLLNTVILLSFGFMSPTAEAIKARLFIIFIQYVVYVPLMIILFPTLINVFKRIRKTV